jgi:uncharacterized protein YggE
MNHLRLIALPSCFFLFAMMTVILPRTARSQARDTVPILTVVGTGEATARPDTADIQAGVVSEASTAREALSANTAAMQAFYTTLSGLHIAERDIQTATFNVSPMYGREERRGQPPRIVAYRVENRVRLTIRDLARLGEILDILVTQGANTIHGIQFRVGEPQPVLDRARQAAVADAQHRATLYARAAGVTLGRVLSLREEHVPPPSPVLHTERMLAAEAAVPVALGETTFTIRLVVTYELAG